ncbi:MAG: hypothetical protein U5R46_07085 [Gammaproteobacteria bacterium]|nr:hypothetical protein [Gammaproteobacteria bacterium]
MSIVASAPGKVVIIGEYAVLEGAPALVMAVDRRVQVSLHPHDDSSCSVTAPGLTTDRGRFRLETSGPTWLEGDAATFRLATHTMAGFFAASGNGWPCRPFDLILDSTPLTANRNGKTRKLGLGASAALTVALCHALGYHVASQHEAVPMPDLERLVNIHAGLQGSRGSGLDIAASLHGGIIEYSRFPSPRAAPTDLPDDVSYAFVWTGREASTGGFLAQIDRWRRDGERSYQAIMGTLSEIARGAASAARGNEAQTFLDCINEYADALEVLGSASSIDILSAPHRRLQRLARRYGVVYKPCGAGGGDIGVGMSRDPEALAGFRSGLAAGNFQPLSLRYDREGVETRSGN